MIATEVAGAVLFAWLAGCSGWVYCVVAGQRNDVKQNRYFGTKLPYSVTRQVAHRAGLLGFSDPLDLLFHDIIVYG